MNEQLSFEPIETGERGDRMERETEQAIKEQVESMCLEWQRFHDEIESRLEKLETLSPAKDKLGDLALLQRLQDENQQLKAEQERLKQELEKASGKLAQFRQLLLDEAGEDSSPDRNNVKNPDAISTETPVPVEPRKKQRAGRKPGSAIKRASQVFLKVQEWNRHHPEQTFVVNPGMLEKLFGINRQAAKQFCEEYQEQLWEHHQEIGVEVEMSHNRGKDSEALISFVNRQT